MDYTHFSNDFSIKQTNRSLIARAHHVKGKRSAGYALLLPFMLYSNRAHFLHSFVFP